MGRTRNKRDEWLEEDSFNSKKKKKEARRKRKEARHRKENWDNVAEVE